MQRCKTPTLDLGRKLIHVHLRVIAAALSLLVLIAAAPPSNDVVAAAQSQLQAARRSLVGNFKVVDQRSGLASSLEERIDADLRGGPSGTDKPQWMSNADYGDYIQHLAQLDVSLVNQYVSGKYHNLAEVRGADDTVFKSPVDGTMQPLAVYVPQTYDPHHAAPLVMFLHGRTCSENDPIALPWLRAAADSTGAIVIAPYARGDSQYVDPAPTDVYASLALAKKAFTVDAQRVYLVGHSMGGYGVFIVGPQQPANWAAVMAVSGGMTTETVQAALRGLQNVPVYLVIGSDDPIVPKGYMQQNQDLLQKSGIEVHYYEQAGGAHAIGTISTVFSQAWHDMFARKPGSRNTRPTTAGPEGIPVTPIPMSTRRP